MDKPRDGQRAELENKQTDNKQLKWEYLNINSDLASLNKVRLLEVD
jgi:hypothetical protein